MSTARDKDYSKNPLSIYLLKYITASEVKVCVWKKEKALQCKDVWSCSLGHLIIWQSSANRSRKCGQVMDGKAKPSNLVR